MFSKAEVFNCFSFHTNTIEEKKGDKYESIEPFFRSKFETAKDLKKLQMSEAYKIQAQIVNNLGDNILDYPYRVFS